MPTTYNDQALGGNFDPGVPPTLPASVTVTSISLLDADDDGLIESNGSDQVNGSNVTNVWAGDTVTIDGVTITGTTFYTADGGRYFTPTDGSVLNPGTVTATTFVTSSTDFDVGDLGPPCFAAGTRIATPNGERNIEDLEIGDAVLTLENGPQPIRWIGQRKVGGRGKFAPIRICANAMGNHRDLYVSPQHRMMLCDWRAQLHLGEDKAFCPANRLTNGDTIYSEPCDQVTYFHIMFDTHEVIYAEGASTESFLVGDIHAAKDSATLTEILEIFPEIDLNCHRTSALPILRGFEAAAMVVLAELPRTARSSA